MTWQPPAPSLVKPSLHVAHTASVAVVQVALAQPTSAPHAMHVAPLS